MRADFTEENTDIRQQIRESEDPQEQENAESVKERRAFRMVGRIFAVLGVLFLAVAIIDTSIFQSNTAAVQAVVVDVEKRTYDGDTTYAPIYRYVYQDEEYTSISNVSYSHAVCPDIGSRKTIHISKKNQKG